MPSFFFFCCETVGTVGGVKVRKKRIIFLSDACIHRLQNKMMCRMWRSWPVYFSLVLLRHCYKSKPLGSECFDGFAIIWFCLSYSITTELIQYFHITEHKEIRLQNLYWYELSKHTCGTLPSSFACHSIFCHLRARKACGCQCVIIMEAVCLGRVMNGHVLWCHGQSTRKLHYLSSHSA